MVEEVDQGAQVTPPIRANLARLKTALYEWLVKEDILGDAKFYTIEQWHQRGEEFLNGALLILVFDGSTLHTILNFGGDTDEFDDLIDSFGFYYEFGHSWNLGIYPCEDYNYSRLLGPYTDKLKDPRWQKKAEVVKQRANKTCQDCGATTRLEAHHCYYTSMREGYEPWEYPLSALRVLCRECHVQRERSEIRMRAFAASMSHQQLGA
jgi:hypothetical protein